MSLIDGVFACAAGDMPLSQRMHLQFTERFPEQRERPDNIKLGAQVTRWFCPGCGVPLDRESQCPSCGRSLRGLLFHLVELHPHREESSEP